MLMKFMLIVNGSELMGDFGLSICVGWGIKFFL